eukprot:scaffold203146_cov35-Tisochrysis_lutea.AAC.1
MGGPARGAGVLQQRESKTSPAEHLSSNPLGHDPSAAGGSLSSPLFPSPPPPTQGPSRSRCPQNPDFRLIRAAGPSGPQRADPDRLDSTTLLKKARPQQNNSPPPTTKLPLPTKTTPANEVAPPRTMPLSRPLRRPE